jgi:hypothetical protein
MRAHVAHEKGQAYMHFGIELVIDFVVMYFVRCTMIAAVGDPDVRTGVDSGSGDRGAVPPDRRLAGGDPIVFRIGEFEVTGFGLLVAIAALVGLWLFEGERRRSDLPDGTVDAAMAGIVGGLVASIAPARKPMPSGLHGRSRCLVAGRAEYGVFRPFSDRPSAGPCLAPLDP